MGIKKFARELKLKMSLKNMEWPSFVLSSIFTMPRRIIILLPDRRSHIPDLRELLKELGDLFASARFYIVGNPQGPELGEPGGFQQAERLRPCPEDLTWSGMPGKKLIEKIRQFKGELLIDLSIGRNHYNAYLAACSQAPIRIGSFGSWGPPIYNLEIKTNYLQNEQLIIKSIVEVLRGFKSGIHH